MPYSSCGVLPFGLSAKSMDTSDNICGSGTEFRGGKCVALFTPQQVIHKIRNGHEFSIDLLHEDFFTKVKSMQTCGNSHINTISCNKNIVPTNFKLHSNGCLQNVETGKYAHLESANNAMQFHDDTCVSKGFSVQLEESTGNMNILWRNPYDNKDNHCISLNGIQTCRADKFWPYEFKLAHS